MDFKDREQHLLYNRCLQAFRAGDAQAARENLMSKKEAYQALRGPLGLSIEQVSTLLSQQGVSPAEIALMVKTGSTSRAAWQAAGMREGEISRRADALIRSLLAENSEEWPAQIDSDSLADACLNLHFDRSDSEGMGESDLPDHIRSCADSYSLKVIPLASLPEEEDAQYEVHDHKVKKYTSLESKAPPVVLDREGYPIDGMHRIISARKRGESEIEAYVPNQRS